MRARFSDLTFDSDLRLLSREGRTIALTPKAFEVLEALVETWPAAISKESLYERLWSDVVVEPGNLHNLISEIRAAIGDEERTIIRTIHRFGYSLGVPIESDAPSSAYLILGTREIPLREGENIIGRDLVGTPDVSRRHARIVIEGMTAMVEDLGSKNGTFTNGEPVKSPVAVSNYQEIVFGRTRAILRFAGPRNSTITVAPIIGSRE